MARIVYSLDGGGNYFKQSVSTSRVTFRNREAIFASKVSVSVEDEGDMSGDWPALEGLEGEGPEIG